MNYEEASKYILTVKWKVSQCQQGEECWCRVIEPEKDITDDDGNEIYIAPSGTISKLHAEHIVNLHNKSLYKRNNMNVLYSYTFINADSTVISIKAINDNSEVKLQISLGKDNIINTATIDKDNAEIIIDTIRNIITIQQNTK